MENNISESNNLPCHVSNHVSNHISDHISNHVSNHLLSSSLSSPWNPNIMKLLKRIGEVSMGYKWMHDAEYYHYLNLDSRYTRIEIILITITTLLTSGAFLGIVGDYSSDIVIMSIIVGLQLIFSLIYAMIKAFRENSDIPMRVLKHNLSSLRFSELYTKIQEQFVLDVSRRHVDTEFVQHITSTYNTLLFDSPDIRNKTMKSYLREIKDKNIYKPTILGGIDEIEIVLEEPSIVENELNNLHNLSYENETNSLYNYEINKWTHSLID